MKNYIILIIVAFFSEAAFCQSTFSEFTSNEIISSSSNIVEVPFPEPVFRVKFYPEGKYRTGEFMYFIVEIFNPHDEDIFVADTFGADYLIGGSSIHVETQFPKEKESVFLVNIPHINRPYLLPSGNQGLNKLSKGDKRAVFVGCFPVIKSSQKVPAGGSEKYNMRIHISATFTDSLKGEYKWKKYLITKSLDVEKSSEVEDKGIYEFAYMNNPVAFNYYIDYEKDGKINANLDDNSRKLIRITKRLPIKYDTPPHPIELTWQAWKKCEDDLPQGTVRDEIRLSRIMFQYDETKDEDLLKELKEWFSKMNEVQSAVMAESVFYRAWYSNLSEKPCFEAYKEIYHAIREYDLRLKLKSKEDFLKDSGLIP